MTYFEADLHPSNANLVDLLPETAGAALAFDADFWWTPTSLAAPVQPANALSAQLQPFEEVFDMLRSQAETSEVFRRFDEEGFGPSELTAGNLSVPQFELDPAASLARSFDPSSSYFFMSRSTFEAAPNFSAYSERLEPVLKGRGQNVFADTVVEESTAIRTHVLPSTRVLMEEVGIEPANLNTSPEDPELARRLAMIRQDMGAFGAGAGIDARRSLQPILEHLEFYG